MDIAPATNPSEQPTRRRNLKWYSSIDQAFHPTDSLIPPENRDRFYWVRTPTGAAGGTRTREILKQSRSSHK
jgi:hypothetical protein